MLKMQMSGSYRVVETSIASPMKVPSLEEYVRLSSASYFLAIFRILVQALATARYLPHQKPGTFDVPIITAALSV